MNPQAATIPSTNASNSPNTVSPIATTQTAQTGSLISDTTESPVATPGLSSFTSASASASASSSVVTSNPTGPSTKQGTVQISTTTTVIVPQSSSSSAQSSTSLASASSSGPSSSTATTPLAGHTTSPTTISNAGGNHSSSLSTGTKAGVAVGAVIIAVGLAIVVFLLIRRKSRRLSTPRHEPLRYDKGPSDVHQYPSTSGAERAIPISTVGYSHGTHGGSENQVMLAQQADDATVTSRFTTIYDQIELHIENFYLDASPIIPPTAEGALSHYDTPQLGLLASALEESPRATTILKHVLAYQITTMSIAPSLGTRKRSLLPADLLDALNEVQLEQQAQDYQGSTPTSAYAWLKSLAAQYRARSLSTDFNAATSPAVTAEEAATHFSHTFSLWADPKFNEQHRTQHLCEVMRNATSFTIWLLSQPEQFEVKWGLTGDQPEGEDLSGRLIIIPALIKTTGQGGQRLQWEGPVLREAVWRNV